MSTLYTLSILNEYTWTALYLDKKITLSYVATSKSQAISGLLSILEQIEGTKKYIEILKTKNNDPDVLCKQILDLQSSILVNLYVSEQYFQYSYHTIVTSLTGQQITIGDLINRIEPVSKRFRLGTIKDH